MLHAVIMAGGGGTRFWPRSRQKRPKQFLKLTSDLSLLQQAQDRIEAVVPPERTWIMTAAAHCDQVATQLPNIPAERIIGEPCGRDTAACIGLGAALIAREDSQATMLVMPADHVIEPAAEFRRACHVAERIVEDLPRALVTFGISPTYSATGYGYIQRGPEIARRQEIGVFKVESFREKPKAELAQQFVASGQYFWNSGIFCWKAANILKELADNQAQIASAVQRIALAWAVPERDQAFRREYEALGKISIDFAVMEKAKEVLVIEAPFRWDDVGSWSALERMHPQDADGNTVLAHHCGLETRNCLVVGDAGRLITTVGVENLLIVEDGDAILVADRRDEAGVKKLVELLKHKGLERYL